MDVKDAITKRRAYRSLDPVKITDQLIQDLAGYAGLAPSCYNKQPWRFVFVYDPKVLEELSAGISGGNKWTRAASLIVAVCTAGDMDCVVDKREYALFDTGMASAFLILRAIELDLVAHPIAGYDEARCREILKIPPSLTLITLICIGEKSSRISPALSTKMAELEKKRPPRLPFGSFVYKNFYSGNR
jgi:nitroreductase